MAANEAGGRPETAQATPANTPEADRRWSLWLASLLAVGFILRTFGAWCLQHATNSDFGIVALMARHMAEGTDFPVFFYGQPYMGSFEPALSALCCKLLGCNGLSVCLGTAWLACAFLPIVYAWARDARDRVAGAAALLFSLVGTFAYCFYCAAPRGGYVSTLLFGSLTVWLAGRLAVRAWRGQASPAWQFVALGLGAGIGWWSNQLVLPFYAAAAVTLLIGFKGRVFRPALLLGSGLSFLAGSLPWWLWNARHGWETFQFAGTLGATPFGEGLRAFGAMLAELLGFDELPPVVGLVLLAAYGLPLLAYGLELRSRWRARDPALLLLLLPVWLTVFTALVYAPSHFATLYMVRYVLPVFPALAIAVGVGTARLAGRTRLGWLPLLVLVAAQAPSLAKLARHHAETRPRWAAAAQVAERLRALDITTAYGSYQVHWMNFATREALCVTGLETERYAPYARRAAAATNVAYFADHLGIGEFISRSGGSTAVTLVGGYTLLHGAQPPAQAFTYLPTQAMTRVAVSGVAGSPVAAADWRAELHDLNLDTGFAATLTTNAEACLEWTLTPPARVCGLRVFNARGDYPELIRIEGRRAGGAGAWEELLPGTVTTTLFWSGDRVYFQGPGYFLENRFPSGTFTALRLHVSPGALRPQRIVLGEVAWLQPDAAAPAAAPAVDALLALLQTRGIARLYAPRHVSERVCQRTRGAVETPVPDLYTRAIGAGPAPLTTEAPVVNTLDRPTALLVSPRDAARTRACLATAGVAATETPAGAWLLFACPTNPSTLGHVRLPLRWTETGCLLAPRGAAKANADYWYRQGLAATDPAHALAYLQRAVAFYPACQPALAALATRLEQAGRAPESAACRQELARQTQPAQPCTLTFAPGVSLLGLDTPTQAVRRGTTFELTYYWTCPPTVTPANWAPFVHFVLAKRQPFQDDHVLLADVAPEYVVDQPFPEVFRVTRSIAVPADAPPGTYRIRLGLLDRVTGQRARPRTELPERKRAVWLPATVRVEAP